MTVKLELSDISKSFAGTKVLDNVNFRCFGGEVHAIVGENGAGKSTLIKVLCGVYAHDSGSIKLDDQPQSFVHSQQAIEAGISVVFQEFSLLPHKEVSENIFLGREILRNGLLDRKTMRAETDKILTTLGVADAIRSTELVSALSVAQQQMVEIAKAISVNAHILILDEPTAALNSAEADILFSILKKMRADGVAVVYISHRMQEVFELSDRITVLKDGQLVDEYRASDTNANEIVRAMVGRDVGDFYPPLPSELETGEALVELLSCSNQTLKNIDVDIYPGQILGVAGLEGAGQIEFAEALYGVGPFVDGHVRVAGEDVKIQDPRHAISLGIGYLSADRKAEGLVLMQSVRDNAALAVRAKSKPFSSPHSNAEPNGISIDQRLEDIDVRASGFDQQIQYLSGGNQQKTIIARWLAMNSRLLIFVEPTRGIDVNSKAAIYKLMRDLTESGVAVVVVSSDLPELIGISDRTIIFHQGEIAGELPSGASEEQIMLYATGHPTPEVSILEEARV